MTREMENFQKLVDDIRENWQMTNNGIAVVGMPDEVLSFKSFLLQHLDFQREICLYTLDGHADRGTLPIERLRSSAANLIVITADHDKEAVVRKVLPLARSTTKLIFAGYGHYQYYNPIFENVLQGLLASSLANGYPHCRIHLFQVLENAARLRLKGAVAEFGVFKGGTTQFLCDTISSLGQDWPVFAFDTFDGFPDQRTPADSYAHPGAVYRHYERIEALLAGSLATLVRGDICETASSLRDQPMIMSFIDTDNYSSAKAAIQAVQNSTVVGGAIVFDHYTGVDRFRYTLGERMAANELLSSDRRYFNLHGTGVFLRLM